MSFRELNVRAYGAAGDGTTDDTAAIQMAVDSLGYDGGKIFFPPGTYKFTSTITISNQKVLFEGMSTAHNTTAARGGNTGSVLYYTGSGTGISVLQVSDHAGWGFTARNMGFRATPSAAVMIAQTGMIWGKIENCWADAAQAQGDTMPPVDSTATFLKLTEGNWHIHHCTITRWNIGLDFDSICNCVVVDGATYIAVNNIGIRIGNTDSNADVVIRDTVVHSNRTTNIQVKRCIGLRIKDCYFEDGDLTGGADTTIELAGVSAATDIENVEIVGNYFSGQGGTQSPITLTRCSNVWIANNTARNYLGTGNLGFIKNNTTAVAGVYLQNNTNIPFDAVAYPEISSYTGVVFSHTSRQMDVVGGIVQSGTTLTRFEGTGASAPSNITGIGVEVFVSSGTAGIVRAISRPAGALQPLRLQGSAVQVSTSTFANDAAAIASGLTRGDLYHTSGGTVMRVL